MKDTSFPNLPAVPLTSKLPLNRLHLFQLICLLCISLALPANAHDEETLLNVVNLQAQAEREIPNDQMIVTLVTEHEGSDATKLASLINLDMEWALAIVKKSSFVKNQTKSYTTYPVYDEDQEISGWRANQELELKSENIGGLSELTGKLQEKLHVRQMTFSPTDATRKKYENELIEEAMEAFKERVELVKKHMDDKNHRVVNISVNTGGYQPPMMYERMAPMAMEKAAAPAVEAGTSKITVTVNGSVQFF